MPKVMQVIESTTIRGKGVRDNPSRLVTQYHTFDGILLAESDPHPIEKEKCSTQNILEEQNDLD